MGIRSFLAFELPPEIREQIGMISGELRRSRLPARWVKKENIHLTIVFLGSVDENVIEDIKGRVSSVVKGFSIFRTRLSGLGVFPNWRKPRVLWVGLNGDVEPLSLLRDQLQRELKAFGLHQETRPFRPHLTLGRFKGPVRHDEDLKWILDKYHDIAGDLYRLEELVLFRSDLKPDGPVYTKMAAWPLGRN
jgi:2'-5' RNA ligase